MISPGDVVVDLVTFNKQGVGKVNPSVVTGVLRRNGTIDAGVDVTFSNVTLGNYTFTFTIPGSYSAGDDLQVVSDYTIDTIPYSSVIWSQVVEVPTEPTVSGIVVDGSTVISQAMTTPKKVENDEGKVEERSIAELIMADQYINQGNATGPPYGMKISRTRPGGTV